MTSSGREHPRPRVETCPRPCCSRAAPPAAAGVTPGRGLKHVADDAQAVDLAGSGRGHPRPRVETAWSRSKDSPASCSGRGHPRPRVETSSRSTSPASWSTGSGRGHPRPRVEATGPEPGASGGRASGQATVNELSSLARAAPVWAGEVEADGVDSRRLHPHRRGGRDEPPGAPPPFRIAGRAAARPVKEVGAARRGASLTFPTIPQTPSRPCGPPCRWGQLRPFERLFFERYAGRPQGEARLGEFARPRRRQARGRQPELALNHGAWPSAEDSSPRRSREDPACAACRPVSPRVASYASSPLTWTFTDGAAANATG